MVLLLEDIEILEHQNEVLEDWTIVSSAKKKLEKGTVWEPNF